MANDATIISVIAFILVTFGLVYPLMLQEFDVNADFNENLTAANDYTENLKEHNSLDTWDFILSLAGIFTFGFGMFAWYVELMILPLKLVFYFIIARNVWIGGGG